MRARAFQVYDRVRWHTLYHEEQGRFLRKASTASRDGDAADRSVTDGDSDPEIGEQEEGTQGEGTPTQSRQAAGLS